MHENVAVQLFLVLWIFLRSVGFICYYRWVLSELHKNYFNDWCVMNSQPTFLFLTSYELNEMAIFSKGCKWDNFESQNSLILSFTDSQVLCSNFVDCESFLESDSPDILAVWQTNLDNSIDTGNFSLRGYLPLIWKDSVTHMHCLAVYVKEGIRFAQDLTLETSVNLYLCFWLSLLHSISYFFFLNWSPSSSS